MRTPLGKLPSFSCTRQGEAPDAVSNEYDVDIQEESPLLDDGESGSHARIFWHEGRTARSTGGGNVRGFAASPELLSCSD
jgi:hypothetical protein